RGENVGLARNKADRLANIIGMPSSAKGRTVCE
ncbi:MAG: hypothetical protein ACI9XK_004464, partial [Granulosicoccus sp.]